jgi:hypothetical protein
MPANTERVPTTYRLRMQNGTERVLTMPRTWRITFGPNVPGAPGRSRGPYVSSEIRGFCFRVYDPQKLLKLVIPDVVEFWEEGTFTLEVLERDNQTSIITQRVSLNRRSPVQQVLNSSSSWDSSYPGMRRTVEGLYEPDPSIQRSFQEQVYATQEGGIASEFQNLASPEQIEGNG